MKSLRVMFSSIVVAASVVLPSIEAQIIVVPDDEPTLGDAFDALTDDATIRIKAGTYFLGVGGEQHRLKVNNVDRVTIEPYGNGTVVIDGGSSVINDAVRIYGGSTNVTIQDITFRNCLFAAIHTPKFGGSGHHFLDLIIEDSVRQGVLIHQPDCTFTRCEIRGTINPVGATAGSGFYCFSGSDRLTLIDCLSEENDKFGFHLHTSPDAIIEDCTAYKNGSNGLVIQNDSDDFFVDGGTYEQNTYTGIQIENCSDGGRVIGATSKNNNTTGGGGECGIWVDDSSDILIDSCLLLDNQLGINIDAESGFTSQNVVIRFCEIYDNDKNTTADSRAGGISFHRVDGLAMYHNTIWRNGTTAGSQNGSGEDRGGVTAMYDHASASANANSDVLFVNNVVGKVDGLANANVVQWQRTAELNRLDYNCYYTQNSTWNVDEYHIGSTEDTFADYEGSSSDGVEDNSFDASSLPINDSTFVPVAGGDARNNAGPIGVVSSQNGTTVYTDQAFAFKANDVITITGTSTVTVTVTYVGSNYITVSSVPTGISSGDGISIKRGGIVFDDIGAKAG